MNNHLIRTETEKKMNRWYSVCVQPTLLDPVAVICAWGRRHSSYQRLRVLSTGSPEAAEELAVAVIAGKIRRGYSLRRTDE